MIDAIKKFNQLFPDTVLPYFIFVINMSLTKPAYPSAWKRFKIIRLLKQTATNLISDFRPVTILSPLSKVFEYIIKNQINSFLVKHYLQSCQFGLRGKDDCFAESNSCYLPKAFDTVSAQLLCAKLVRFFNFSCSSVGLIHM